MNKSDYNHKMSIVRKEIDDIDSELKSLLVKRMKCSERVAGIKIEASMPVYDAEREKAIFERIRNEYGEYGFSLSAIYTTIMSVSRAKQHEIFSGGKEIREIEKNAEHDIDIDAPIIACQGVEGAYSHKAAAGFRANGIFQYKETWKEVFEAIEKGSVDFGVLPVENSSAGSVSDVYKLIMEYRFYIVETVAVKVEHCIAVSPFCKEIKKVISHPQGLSQCSMYIEEKDYKIEEFSNTATAAKYISESKSEDSAAICSEYAAEKYGLKIISRNIQNVKDNTTRFAVISKKPYLPTNAEKISLCFSLPHVTGSLYNVLERFSIVGLNLTKIESKPILGKKFEYDFYLDFTGNIHDTETLDLICSLYEELPRFSFLGNYNEISI